MEAAARRPGGGRPAIAAPAALAPWWPDDRGRWPDRAVAPGRQRPAAVARSSRAVDAAAGFDRDRDDRRARRSCCRRRRDDGGAHLRRAISCLPTPPSLRRDSAGDTPRCAAAAARLRRLRSAARATLAAQARDLRRRARAAARQYSRTVTPAGPVRRARALVAVARARFATVADADLAALLHAEMQSLHRAATRRRKQRTGTLDFLDLLIRARDLVRDCAPVRRDVPGRASASSSSTSSRTPIRCRPSCCCCWRAIADRADSTAAASAPGALFVVGDPEAVDLSIPPRRRRHLPESARALWPRRRDARSCCAHRSAASRTSSAS